jgi:hypothetical protein
MTEIARKPSISGLYFIYFFQYEFTRRFLTKEQKLRYD